METTTLFAIPQMPLIQPGDDLAAVIVDRLHAAGERLQPGDILVIAQKVVSKAEGRLVRLSEVQVTDEARALAAVVDKDPRVVQVILDDSRDVIRSRRGLLVVEQKAGWICANAGVDRSNVAGGDGEVVALLPEDPDGSAARIRQRLAELTGVAPAVLINDSHGRPWRLGTVGVCIGCAGLPPLWNQRGLHDLFGYELVSSEECIADELAAAASLLMGQSSEGRPVVIIRGYRPPSHLPPAPARNIQRPAQMDAFR
ncbi:coenzyme F420-0:L-glutamate ligase [Litorilinea aerophila]|uniref:Coenzyme F420-0:L-glutamate ligase n=1 Tax=Litorilinea aerophila TaxID=1204385 RepID=A0A540VBJ1_9CHLR|nr:coenzyme F420-0:L-glutamate ligase [Litorilinea aerophila]MCC9078026.1 coenzyme F420-0:L-glutamate ligase [Litorilinea aerophila]OUC06166.1 F420-0--gamma-glutamyl ligase [Litorilinea aerophila]GIV75979.1 MAG: F420-0--gamma-glutamyl ligase [Litorilinea sp.]